MRMTAHLLRIYDVIRVSRTLHDKHTSQFFLGNPVHYILSPCEF